MRKQDRVYRDRWIPNYYPPREIRNGRFALFSRTGTLQILGGHEKSQLSTIFLDSEFHEKLAKTGHIITRENALRVMEMLETRYRGTYDGPRLHIVVLTRRCNLNCAYCHMNPVSVGHSLNESDMSGDTIREVVRFALGSPSPTVSFEFQGGEPFLNFDGMREFVLEAHRQNEVVGKELEFSVVSNLMLVRKHHLDWCRENHVSISYSLNGPQWAHDLYRVTRTGKGSFATVFSRLREMRENYSDVLSSAPLCVIGADNATRLIEIIDFYHNQGFNSVAILKLKRLGNSAHNDLPFNIDDFLQHYLDALNYLYEKNRAMDVAYSERIARVVIAKIICDTDINFVDWRNPCGDFGGAITYDFDGEILPSDEARSLREKFGLGNVRTRTYEELVDSGTATYSMNLSLRDRDEKCRECAYNPLCGVSPVLDYARTGDARPVPHESEECKRTIAVLDWILKKLEDDPVPLLRMIPGMDDVLKRTIAEGRGIG